MDESGVIKEKKVNAVATYLYGVGRFVPPVVGDVLVMAVGYRNGERDLVGLSSEDIVRVKHICNFELLFMTHPL